MNRLMFVLAALLLSSLIVTTGYDVKRVGCGHYRVTPTLQ